MTDHEQVLAAFGALGFDEWQTGGGCTAFGLNLRNGEEEIGYILVSDNEGDGAPTSMHDRLVVGFYDVEGETTEHCKEDLSVAEAIDYVHWIDANVGVSR